MGLVGLKKYFLGVVETAKINKIMVKNGSRRAKNSKWLGVASPIETK
jgi:hypothetical protein